MAQEIMRLPLLPLRDVVVFPKMIIPLFVGRDHSVKAIEKALENHRQIILVTQKDSDVTTPKLSDVYTTGVVANVLQMLKLPDGTVKVLIEGTERFKLTNFLVEETGYIGEGIPLLQIVENKVEIEALKRSLLSSFQNYAQFNEKLTSDVIDTLEDIQDGAQMADTVTTYLGIRLSEKQAVLEILDVQKRLEHILALVEAEITLAQVEDKIRSRVKGQMEKNQREYYLNEQLKAIHKELGEEEDDDEFTVLNRRIQNVKLSPEAKKKAEHELKKLKAMSPMSSEASVVRNYLDWLLSLPWNSPKKFKIDLPKAQKVLDQDHEALDKVKERILEHLAVQARLKSPKGQILCLVGPPGVGKTSLATSIAKATGRDFVRAALGGVRDESEIRGHRRTYIGSMPGRIIQSLKKASSSNPVFLLDEIDKLGADWKGDPTSALLEVLDPEQNHTFNDHYLEVDFDLSKVMFIATANTLNMPQPLIDRMEVIRLSGYTEQEKIEIAKKHLLRRALEANGLKKGEFVLEDDALVDVVRYYTREAGVRNLQRDLNKIARKAVRKILEGESKKITVTSENLKDFLGVHKYKYGAIETEDQVGVTTGLAWTEVGGEILQIEAVVTSGKGKVTMTGTLGDVMQESVQAAHSFIKFKAADFGIDIDRFENSDIHIHVPEGATPKDGPSAGITMCVSIVSAFTGISVRKDIAMTGEVTLRGRVLPIGGLKEKLLAALRSGIKTVLIPEENVKDLEEIPETIKGGLNIIPVNHVGQVIQHALTKLPQPIPPKDNLGGDIPTVPIKPVSKKRDNVTRH
ncbi:MAG: endopeptidase La [Candidatus Paracaedibacteraceae bacterium]|nr:endopeptidase La [Candidatus Paracaedibacteraceae bacterium]